MWLGGGSHVMDVICDGSTDGLTFRRRIFSLIPSSFIEQGQELTNRCVPELPNTYPRLALELPRLALERVIKTFPNLFHHFGHFCIIKK